MQQKNITLIGAGLVGSLLSILLAKRGHKVSIYERRPDMRKTKIQAGRSINLALSERGWKALRLAGIETDIQKVAIPMKGRMIHGLDGSLNFQPYGKEDQAIYSVSRAGLNMELMTLAEKHGAEIHFDEKAERVYLDKGTVKFKNQITVNESEVAGDHVFSSDGAFSAGRLELQLTDRYNYSQQYLEYGYKELSIPSDNGNWRLEKNALHIWPRGKFMLIALPNTDGSFTCTLFFPYEGEPSFASLKTDEDIKEFFSKVFPDAFRLMPDLLKDFNGNPTGSLVTVKCFPWSYKDKLLLIGDAAHAIVPFFGQGMNCGFEDCTVLDKLMDSYGDDFNRIFPEFQTLRKPDTDAIAELALQNFIEMRDLVADPKFLLRKKIESRLNEKYPDKWIPLYSMVTFMDFPYSYAYETGRKQDRIMERVMKMDKIEDRWDSPEVEQEIEKLLSELSQ